LLHEVRVMLHQAWQQLQNAVSTRTLDPFPLKKTLKGYNAGALKADFRAGLDGALLAIPQGMAFAVVAGLPLAYGITCSAVACVVGALLMSSRHSIYGPTNATAFMVSSYFAAFPDTNQLAAMPMLVFLVGALLVLGAYFRVADLARYISRTVVVAYLTGAALLMFAHQLPVVLGQNFATTTGKPAARTLISDLGGVFGNLPTIHWPSALICVLTITSYVGLRRLGRRFPALTLTLILTSVIATMMNKGGLQIATFSDASFTWRDLLPPFPDFTSGNASAQFSQLFALATSLAFVAMLENSAMARTLASKSGHTVDANQDMLSLGAANLACAYFSGMPASHSLTRSLAAYESGAVSPLCAIFGGTLCLVAALTVGPLVAFVPKAALGALVICVAVALIHPRQIRISLRATGSDAVVFLTTFVATLMVPLHVAIFTGVGISLILYLRKASRPSLVEYEFNQEGQLAEAQKGHRQNPSISIVHVEGDLFFGAAELFRTQIQRTCADPNLRIIILRLKNARHLDATSVMALEELVHVLRGDGRDLIVSGALKDVYRVLRDSGLVEVIGRDNIFLGSTTNPNLSTRNALKRAQQILGSTEAEVRIYYDPAKQASGA
jgi:sulfate permease, SulP family